MTSAQPVMDQFERRAALEKAAEARSKGKRKKAIELYRSVLASTPDDHEVHSKLAPILAENGDEQEAIASFRIAADGFHKKGFTDRAIALLRQSVEHVPSDVDAWLRVADLLEIRLKKKEAEKVLEEARTHFTKKSALGAAARLLDAHRKLDPKRIDVAIDRAQVAKRSGQRGFGILLLTDLAAGVDGKARKQLRRALFGLKPTPASFWRWLRNAPAT